MELVFGGAALLNCCCASVRREFCNMSFMQSCSAGIMQ